ncbi:MAG: hypothetical protein IT384_03995 [Deltaproteobacteria bacterium]|nr:hypothetical protein [Deltaproteobacteria bacterium]
MRRMTHISDPLNAHRGLSVMTALGMATAIAGVCCVDTAPTRPSDGGSVEDVGLGTDSSVDRDAGAPGDAAVGSDAGVAFLPWEGGPGYYAQWSHGPSADPSTFPIAVWLQSESNAAAYRAIGINLFVGLWEGPTDAQLSSVQAAGLQTVCDQNAVGLTHASESTIIAWQQQDEPDNAQPDGNGGYGPCIPASEIQTRADAMRAADATRPVYLNLGQGVANDDWVGRGSACAGTSDYPDYARTADILSFDIYPTNETTASVRGNLWYVALGVDRLRMWSDYAKPVWTWIETTRISATGARPTPEHVRAEVWMALVHGARGIGYFVHEFDPFVEAGLLADAEMSAAVGSLNARIQSLAPVLNTPSLATAVDVGSSDPAVPVDVMVKQLAGTTYLFAVSMRDAPTTATFTLRVPDAATLQNATVLDEARTVPVTGGIFTDAFTGYGVHLYQIAR